MSDIAYQNKDITSKIFANRFKGKAFKVYGINMPEIKEVLPTNLPEFRANELRMDNIFLLEDDTIAIIDYESAYKKENKHKYIDYVNRVLAHYEKEWNRHIDARMIVIYTADVTRKDEYDSYDVGCLQFEIGSAYLSEIDKDEVRQRLSEKIKKDETLTDEELMEFILLPMAHKGNEAKNDSIAEEIELVKHIKDEETKIFLLTGLVVFTDKVISEENSKKIRRLISMTKVGQLFEDEAVEREKKAAKKAAKEAETGIVKKLIKSGKEDKEIFELVEFLSKDDIRSLRESVKLTNS